jgi:uncharacterized protein YggE
MRKSVILAWATATALFAGVPAAADSPVSLPPLAPGEVLLETSGVGIARTPATSATLTASISVEAETEAEARRKANDVIQRVTAAARAAGVAPADIRIGEVELARNPYGYSADLNASDMTMNTLESMEAPAESQYASASVTIHLRTAAAAPGLERAIDAIEHASAATPSYELADDSAPRREARAEALRRARIDAETYAASVNMRIARVLRITERAGLDLLPLAVTENGALMREMEGGGRGNRDGQVRTYAVVGVDFALAPR